LALITDIGSRRGSRRRELHVDEQEWRATSADVVSALDLRVGHIEPLEDLTARIEAAEPRLARDRALRLLTYRDRSTADLMRRLSEDGYPAAVAGQVLADLTRVGLVDDARFASSTARVLATIRGFGRMRIMRELDVHGIDSELASAAVAEMLPEEEELDSALRLAKALAARPKADVSRVATRLVRKGFATPLALRAARQALAELGTDEALDLPVLDE
jgi:SOS response regulatory protein OraA/RecX